MAIAILAVAVSLSIGWGIRGNFGHEYGAMIAGVLSSLAACAFSGREDFRRRAPYFGLFGALGWGFGGSCSYMQVIAYTHSGDLHSQAYGFACLFALGFLWASMGGAGVGFAAAADARRIHDLFRPLLWVLGAWLSLDIAMPFIEHWIGGAGDGDRRHEDPLYWFDADWIPALVALLAVLAFDLWDRRFEKARVLLVLAALGAVAGFSLEQALLSTGLWDPIAPWLVRFEGDEAMAAKGGLLINWPQFFQQAAEHLGWMLGVAVGVGAYFWKHGKFRSEASLLLHLAAGWWVAFLALPVLLGVRMTPPRGDDWAGILGVFCGAVLYFARRGLLPALHASLVSGIVGGLGFSGATWLKLMGVAPGNPALVEDPAVIQAWSHWQGANWHSFLEQSYGFVNGIGIALAMGLLARRLPRHESDEPRSRWREGFAVAFVLIGVTYVNLVKNVDAWIKAKTLPAVLRAPLLGAIELHAATWFQLAYAATAVVFIALLLVHARKGLAVVPRTWLGRTQLVYAVFLWWMVLGNFERAVVAFDEKRLITEWVITINAALVTLLVLAFPREDDAVPADAKPFRLGPVIAWGLALLLVATGIETWTTRAVYGDKPAGHSNRTLRFGPDSAWRVQPLLRGRAHP